MVEVGAVKKVFGVLCFIIFLNSFSLAQTPTKLDLCKIDLSIKEEKLKKCNSIQEQQTQEILEVKQELSDSKYEIENLQRANSELQKVSLELMDLGLKLEEQGELVAALEVYKLLIKSFPTTLEGASSKLKVRKLYSDQQNEKNKK